MLAATALEVWCLRFTRAGHLSNMLSMQHAMQKMVALPAGGVSRIIGVSSVALSPVDGVHLVLACERCLDAAADAQVSRLRHELSFAEERLGAALLELKRLKGGYGHDDDQPDDALEGAGAAEDVGVVAPLRS